MSCYGNAVEHGQRLACKMPVIDLDSSEAIIMRLLQIRNFLAVAESGSFRAATRQLGLSQPTITKSIRSLEAALHTQLAQRTQRGVVLTPAGRTFLARARVAYLELRKAEEELAHSGVDSAGTVAFGVGPVAAVLIAPQAVASFHGQFPRARARRRGISTGAVAAGARRQPRFRPRPEAREQA